ncbi:MAG: toprim domain-containing protein [Promethearchaeota archaeon]|jgi:DNA primase
MPKTYVKRRFSLVEREEIVKKAHSCLWTDSGKPGREYLTSQRGLSEDTIREFQLGYIPVFVAHQLRGRVILPLFDPSDNLITVGSRAVDSESYFLPVYWHESYEKPFYLYGINRARESIRQFGFVLVVEGQFDVLQLHNHGVRNVVGLCGNKMSDVQISIIQRYGSEIVLLLDTDENQAGQRGADKILSQSASYDYSTLSWSIINFPVPINTAEPQIMASRPIVSVGLPENSDPDEFVRIHGIEALKKIVKGKRREFHNNTAGC